MKLHTTINKLSQPLNGLTPLKKENVPMWFFRYLFKIHICFLICELQPWDYFGLFVQKICWLFSALSFSFECIRSRNPDERSKSQAEASWHISKEGNTRRVPELLVAARLGLVEGARGLEIMIQREYSKAATIKYIQGAPSKGCCK